MKDDIDELMRDEQAKGLHVIDRDTSLRHRTVPDQKQRKLDQNDQRQVSDAHQVILEGAIQPSHDQRNQRTQVSKSSSTQVQSENRFDPVYKPNIRTESSIQNRRPSSTRTQEGSHHSLKTPGRMMLHSSSRQSNNNQHVSDAQSKHHGLIDHSKSLDTLVKDGGTRPKKSTNDINQLSGNLNSSNGLAHDEIAHEEIATSSNHNRIETAVNELDQEEFKYGKQKPSHLESISKNRITLPNKSHQFPNKTRDVNHEGTNYIEDEMSNHIQEDGFNKSQQQLSERDHTAADYIACALGMEYVNDRSDLTVQPLNNSNNIHNQSRSYSDDDQDNQYYLEGLLEEIPQGQGHSNHRQIFELSTHSNKSRVGDIPGTSKESAAKTTPRQLSLTGQAVTLSTSSGRTEEGPCSPIRQWLKEKENMEGRGDSGTNQTWGESNPSVAGTSVDHQTAKLNSANNCNANTVDANTVDDVVIPQKAPSPAINSQSASPTRQWLSQKQHEEKHETPVMDADLDNLSNGPSSFVVDAATGKISNLKPNRFGYLDSHGDRENEKSLSNQRGRSDSAIPSLVSTKSTSDVKNQETRWRSSSAIPVHISKSSPPKTKVPSPRRMSATTDGHTDLSDVDCNTPEIMKKHGVDPKKGNKYSKIPLPKVYKALQDGGYLETETPSPHKGSLPQQDAAIKKLSSSPRIEHSKSNTPATQMKESRPSLEKQGTFTKETRPPLTKEGTFTLESENEKKQSKRQEVNPSQGIQKSSTTSKDKTASSFSPLALVLDHMAKKGHTPSSRKNDTDGKRRHDSLEETFENSSTESSTSPATKSTTIISKKPTMNVYNAKHYHMNVHDGRKGIQSGVAGSEVKGHAGNVAKYNGLAESDRMEHEGMDDSELEKTIAMKSQLAEIRNLEIENRHLAYEKKEFEAHYIRNMQEHQYDTTSDDET